MNHIDTIFTFLSDILFVITFSLITDGNILTRSVHEINLSLVV